MSRIAYGQIQKGYWIVSKQLASILKSNDAVIVYQELVYWESYHKDKDGWFYYEGKELEENCNIGERIRRNCLNTLQEFGLIEISQYGVHNRYHYKIHPEALDELLIKCLPSTEATTNVDGAEDKCRHSPIYSIKEEGLKEEVKSVDNPTTTSSENLFIEYFKCRNMCRLVIPGNLSKVVKFYKTIENLEMTRNELYPIFYKKNTHLVKNWRGDEELKMKKHQTDEEFQNDFNKYFENCVLNVIFKNNKS